MTIQLYQFPISHYCEKVRFALDYKGLEYRVRNLLPGVHRLTTSRLGKDNSVPLISHNGSGVQGSAQILTYLDEIAPLPALSPEDPMLADEVRKWEDWLDSEVGIDVRLFCYHTLLEHREVVTEFFLSGAPWWASLYMRIGYRALVERMREHMGINDRAAELAQYRIHNAVNRLAAQYADRDYLVAGRFTRADLTAAALLAPMFRPEKYALPWPDVALEPLDSAVKALSPQLEWAHRIYTQHR